jgi:hypothetical protein
MPGGQTAGGAGGDLHGSYTIASIDLDHWCVRDEVFYVHRGDG